MADRWWLDDTERRPVWWQLALALGLGVVWVIAARWNLLVTARPLYPAWDDSTCLAGSRSFARTQGVIALAGLLALGAGVALRLSPTTSRLRRSAVCLAAALVLGVAWLVVLMAFAPSEGRGIYAGCGLG